MMLSTSCFNQCVQTFPSKTCSKDESACIKHCAERYITLSQRVGKKYQEYQYELVKKEKVKQKERVKDKERERAK